MPEFVKAAKADDVPPGGAKKVVVKGCLIALFHVDGTFYAIDNTCIHQGGPLADGFLAGTVVTCPWHAWKFDVRTGVSPVNPHARVRAYPVRIEGDDLLVEV